MPSPGTATMSASRDESGEENRRGVAQNGSAKTGGAMNMLHIQSYDGEKCVARYVVLYRNSTNA